MTISRKSYTFGRLAVAILAAALFTACSGSGSLETQAPVVRDEAGLNIVNLSEVNSAEDDFAPVVLPDGRQLLFTSNRQGEGSAEKLDNKSLFGEALYLADQSGRNWQTPARYTAARTGSRNQGTFALSPDGNEGYFGASYADSTTGGSDIYTIRKTVGQWSTPEPATALNSNWWEAHPAISPDGSTIVFASNREAADPDAGVSGYRTSDLWLSVRTAGGNWSAPARMPGPVNSSFSEISPCFDSGGDLYFATDRFEGQGFEIVRCRRTADGWSEPQPLPAPVNSAADDVFPFIPGDREGLLFASNRSGGLGGLDIYRADFPSRVRLRGSIVKQDQGGSAVPATDIPIIIEDKTAHSSITLHSNPDGTYETRLEQNHEYTIRTGASECYLPVTPQTIRVGQPRDFDTVIVRDFAVSRLMFPQFRLDRYNIPFFVTGYYHPNTRANLDLLDERFSKGELNASEGGNTPFIDRNDEQYRSYAVRIEAIFDTIYTSIIGNYLPLFNACAMNTEKLLIEVRGYVDPRGLTPGYYPDETVDTYSMTIKKGDRMAGQDGNTKLANLRAFHTMQMLDRELSARSELYRGLKQAGRVKLQAQGVGIDTISGGSVHDPSKRRIDIELAIVK